ncbi:GNAT family N-acetyltransferase (plasmid) [Pseudoalteromonas sp. T1lg65]|uniref:GNAT family N-acetyltransferase n=1 Tax=Pseudoalteromonas sp. T1lg65 TaxID=2077101 RepID=UPI003F79BBD0
MAPFTLREASLKDCELIAALSIQVWLETYAKDGIKPEIAQYVLTEFTPEHFAHCIRNSNKRILVCTSGNYLCGYVMVNLASDCELGDFGFEVEKCYVHQAFKGRGIGQQLMEAVKAQFGECFWLYTWIENQANGFYQHLGYQLVGIHRFTFNHVEIINNVYVSGLQTCSKAKL